MVEQSIKNGDYIQDVKGRGWQVLDASDPSKLKVQSSQGNTTSLGRKMVQAVVAERLPDTQPISAIPRRVKRQKMTRNKRQAPKPKAKITDAEKVSIPEMKSTIVIPEKIIGHPSFWHNFSGRRLMLLTGGILSILLGMGILVIWYQFAMRQAIVAFPGLLLIGGGVFLIYRMVKGITVSSEIILTGKPIEKKQVNSLSIYEDTVLFEDVVKPEGQPQKCLNDGKHYFVNIWNTEKLRLVPFILPDQQYRDPGNFATRVLELPAHRRIFRRREKWTEQLKPVFVGVMIVVVAILILITTEPA